MFEQNRQVFSSDTVILTRSNDYADSLTATPLAAALKAPVLTTGPDGLDPRVLESLKAQGIKNVVVIGGDKAISPAAVTALRGAGLGTERIAGASRYETALKVAEKVMAVKGTESVPVFLATGTNFADALAAGATAAQQGAIVLLTQGQHIDAATADFIRSPKAREVIAIGGPAARAMTGAEVEGRVIQGTDRYDTAAKLAKEFFPNPSSVVLTSGETYADSLSGAALAALTGAPMVLTGSTMLPPQSKAYLAETKPEVTVLGGEKSVPAAVTTTVATDVAGPRPTPTTTPPATTTPPPAPPITAPPPSTGGGAGSSSSVTFTKNLPVETLVSRTETQTDNVTRTDGHGMIRIELSQSAQKFEVFRKRASAAKWELWGSTGNHWNSRAYEETIHSSGKQSGDQYRIVATVNGRTYTSATTTVKIVTPTQTPTIALDAPPSATLPNGDHYGTSPIPVTVTITGGGAPADRVLAWVTRDGYTSWGSGWGLTLDSTKGDVATYKGNIHVPTAGTYKLGYEYLASDVAHVKDVEQEPNQTLTVSDPQDASKKSIDSLTVTAAGHPTAGKATTLEATVVGGHDDASAGTVTFYDGFHSIGTGTYADGKWTVKWTPNYGSAVAHAITARYTKEGYNSKSSTPLSVTIDDFDLEFSIPGGTYQDPVALDAITVGDSTVSLKKGETELVISSADGLRLSDWEAVTWPRQHSGSGAEPTPPVITIDGDDNRIRVSAPEGTTPGVYEVYFHGRVGDYGSASPSARYTIEVRSAEDADADEPPNEGVGSDEPDTSIHTPTS